MNSRNFTFAMLLRSTTLLVALSLVTACGDDAGDGGGGPPTEETPFLYQCGPIACGLGTACVYDPGLSGREEFYCIEDIGCGIGEFTRCIMECSPNPMLPDRECERGCQEAQRELPAHYDCPPPLGPCQEGVSYPILSSPNTSDAGVPFDPRDAGVEGTPSPPGRYLGTFVSCRTEI